MANIVCVTLSAVDIGVKNRTIKEQTVLFDELRLVELPNVFSFLSPFPILLLLPFELLISLSFSLYLSYILDLSLSVFYTTEIIRYLHVRV